MQLEDAIGKRKRLYQQIQYDERAIEYELIIKLRLFVAIVFLWILWLVVHVTLTKLHSI